MKPNVGWLGAIKVKRLDRFFNVGAQFVPRVAFGEDALGEALRAKPAVRLLGYFKDDLVHFLEFKRSCDRDANVLAEVGLR